MRSSFTLNQYNAKDKEAAVVIQKHYRGFTARKQLQLTNAKTGKVGVRRAGTRVCMSDK